MTSRQGRTEYELELNPNLRMSLSHVGAEREPVIFIDDVLAKPQSMIEFAAREVEFTPAWNATGGYPGVRAPAPLNYTKMLVQSLAPVLENAFSLERVKLVRADCYLSLVTRPPDQLAVLQRIPHIDIAKRLRFAFLHYLCGEQFGGTAFYRHRATGFQTINERQEADYLRARDRELAAGPPGPGYINGTTDNYEQTAAVAARFNRVLIYRSQHLHCALIPDAMNFSADPRKGRLTANVFATYVRI